MRRLTRVLGLVVLALAVSASTGTAARPSHVPLLGIVPHAGALHALGAQGTVSLDDVALQESPCSITSTPMPCWTMRTNTTYAIYWFPSGATVSANYVSLINRYLIDVAAASGSANNVYSITTQYYDNSAAIHYQSTFGGAYIDTDPFPASGCGVPAAHCLTDAQLEEEIQNVLLATGWHPSPTTLFFILTPQGVASCSDGTGSVCSTNAFCAYHSGFTSAGQPVVYANMPYDAAIAGCDPGASPNGDAADATINAMSHEQNEAITDPWGDAWLNRNGDEIADICLGQFGTPLGGSGATRFNQVINGHDYWLQEEYSNEGSACLQGYTPASVPSTVAPPLVTGTTAAGQVLSSSEGSWMHAPSSYSYQWERCAANGSSCANIAGATAATYQVTASDVGHVLRSQVSATNAAGTSAFVASAQPMETAAPAISGSAGVGKKLSATSGTWNTDAAFTYQWLRCGSGGANCVGIAGATTNTHVLAKADAGHRLEVQVTATNDAGAAQALSKQSAVIVTLPRAKKAPRISGSARIGRRLRVAHGSWSGPPKSYRYQWLRCNARGGSCARIHRATHSSYRLVRADVRHRLRVRVTALNAAGSRTATTRATTTAR
jgi:hypothetical protein